VQVECVRQLVGCGLGLTVYQREFGDRVRERRQRLRLPARGCDPGQRVRAGVRVVRLACARQIRGCPAQTRQRVVEVVADLPARDDRAAVLGRLVVSAFGCGVKTKPGLLSFAARIRSPTAFRLLNESPGYS